MCNFIDAKLYNVHILCKFKYNAFSSSGFTLYMHCLYNIRNTHIVTKTSHSLGVISPLVSQTPFKGRTSHELALLGFMSPVSACRGRCLLRLMKADSGSRGSERR